MAVIKYQCKDCSKEFPLRYLWSKPKDAKCPYCKSFNTAEVKGCNSCGSGGSDNKGGFKFT